MAEHKSTPPKQQKAKKHYTSKGQRRSSISTAGYSDLFVPSMKHVKVGWTPKERDFLQEQLRSGNFKFLHDDVGD